jgi:hypothetical protein
MTFPDMNYGFNPNTRLGTSGGLGTNGGFNTWGQSMPAVPQMPGSGGGFNLDPLSQNFAEYGFGGGSAAGYNPVGATANGGGGFMGGVSDWWNNTPLFGSTKDGVKTDGMLGDLMGVGKGLMGAYLGMKQYGLAKDTLKFNKQVHSQNYAAQKNMTNSSLEDRQKARIASNSGAYESVGSYMDKNGIK